MVDLNDKYNYIEQNTQLKQTDMALYGLIVRNKREL